jgi:RNA polymerase sigma-70 factor, ECF subfamily
MRGRPRGVPAPATVEARARNRDLLEGVYREYRPFTTHFIARQVDERDRSLVEDLTQETFLRAWPYLDKVEVSQDRPLRGWLATLARQTICHEHREGRRGNQQHAAEWPAAPDSPVWHISPPDQRDSAPGVGPRVRADLAAAMAGLPPAIRQAVELRVANGMLACDVAEELKVSRETVRVRVNKGVEALRATLTQRAAARAPGRVPPDPVARARWAVAQAHQRITAPGTHAAEQDRAQRLARWHADDRASQAQHRSDDRSATAAERGAP